MNKDKLIVAQNAATAAATVYSSFTLGGWDPELYEAIRTAIFEGSLALGEVTGEETTTPAPRGNTSGGGNFTPSKGDNGAGVVIKFGKFSGQTIGQVYERDASYVEWLAESSTNPFIRAKAAEYVAAVA